MTKEAVKEFLIALSNFKGVPEDAIDWLLKRSSIVEVRRNQYLFQPGDAIDELLIIIEGRIRIYLDTPDGRQGLFLLDKGSISGSLPFSRSKGSTATGRVLEDTKLLKLHKSHFVEMVNVSYELTQALVAVMSDRIRDVSSNLFQDEKLKALGKISAGLAHELNNPTSAMVRSAEILYQKLSETPENFKAVMRLNVTESQTDAVNEILFQKIQAQLNHPIDMSLLERENRIDELLDWLEEYEVENAEAIADTLTDYNFTTDDLDSFLEILEDEHKLTPTLNWFDNRLSVESLVVEIKEASTRVSNLVQSVKQYSHMDQGQGKVKTDLHAGLRTTIQILGHQFRQREITIDKQFGESLPAITANPGELNQIWTNLLCNAVDALPKGGTIIIRTFIDCDDAVVEIEDNGTGIPDEILNRIWEPFFTTKAVGEGTGIGLDLVKKIVHRHHGTIKVNSQEGQTIFRISFQFR